MIRLYKFNLTNQVKVTCERPEISVVKALVAFNCGRHILSGWVNGLETALFRFDDSSDTEKFMNQLSARCDVLRLN